MLAVRKRLTYANAMATLAVFISLGGGAYAALRLPANSVGTRQLQAEAVNARKVKKNSLTGAQIKASSLTGEDIKAGSLTGEDIKPGSLSAATLPQFGLSNLYGASGIATNNTGVELAAASCNRYTFAAPGAQPGDAVILQGSDSTALTHAIEGAPTVSNPNQINVSVCATTEAVNQPQNAIQLRFDTLR